MRKGIGSLAVVLALGAGWLARDLWQAPQQVARTASPPPPMEAASGIGCIGHFVPEDGLLRVAAPYYQSRPSVVARLAVKEGDQVRAGQLIAELDGRPQVVAQLVRAQAQLEQARRRLAQVRSGAKPSEVSAQRAELARLESSYQLAQSQFRRAQSLFESKNLSVADFESSRSTLETSRMEVESAKYRLTALTEVREPDVRVAESDVEVSEAQLGETEAQLRALTVYAPIGGRIVKVHAHDGEQVGPEGLVELADLSRMAVEAEVYASDLAKVKMGQRASIEMEGGAAKMSGIVTRIGAEVRQAEVLPNDPVAYSDAHVVPVRIRVPDCRDASCPIHARVKVVIGPVKVAQ